MTLSPETSPEELDGAGKISPTFVINPRSAPFETSTPRTSTFTGISRPTNLGKPKLAAKPQRLLTFQSAQPCQNTRLQANPVIDSSQTIASTDIPVESNDCSKGISQAIGDSLDSVRLNNTQPSTGSEIEQFKKISPIDIAVVDLNNNYQASVGVDEANRNTFHNQRHLHLDDVATSKQSAISDSNGKSEKGSKIDFQRDVSPEIIVKSSRRKQQVTKQDGNYRAENETEASFKNDQPKPPFPFAGILIGVVASFAFSCAILFVKLMGDSNSFEEKLQALLSRGFLITVFTSISLWIQKGSIKIPREQILVNALRAFFGYLGVLGVYLALRYISLGDATALLFLSPIWTSILGHYLLGEPIRLIIFILLPVSLFGTVLIAHPTLLFDITDLEFFQIEPSIPVHLTTNYTAGANSTDINALNDDIIFDTSFDISQRWPGVALALMTSLSASCVLLVLKFNQGTPVQTTTFWFGIYSTMVTSIIMCFTGFGKFPTGIQWVYMLFNGLLSWTGQSLLQLSLRYESSSIISIVRTLDVASSFALSALFLDDEIYWTSLVGASIISAVVITIVVSGYFQDRLSKQHS